MLLPACGGDTTDDTASPVAQSAQQVTQSGPGTTQATDLVFNGICDGSAAVMLVNDTLLVAYDELNTLFAFPLSGGKYTAHYDLDELLDLPSTGEIDIEAAARIDDRIWWVGSHGLNKRGNEEPNRRLLFATTVPSPGLQDLDLLVPPQDLTEVLLESPYIRVVLTKSVRKRAPKDGGVNIEGLAASANGGLLLGFRSPLTGKHGIRGKALLVGLMPEGDRFSVQSVSRLDLGDRGVRAIAGHDDGYVLIAGPVKSANGFSLYGWDGVSQRAELLAGIPDLHAEALVDAGDHWLVLSDDGKQPRADSESADGLRECDSVRRNSRAGESHPGVFFRGRLLAKP
jgi:hypothetical protein